MDEKTLLKKFGTNVKIERIKKNLTQEQLAEKMQLSAKHIGSIEQGRENMSLLKILKLSNFLETKIWKLLDFQDE